MVHPQLLGQHLYLLFHRIVNTKVNVLLKPQWDLILFSTDDVEKEEYYWRVEYQNDSHVLCTKLGFYVHW